MGDSTAMTIDFLRARLLSERSVSRAAKERADQLAERVAELEEQLRMVTAQRKQAERAAAGVVAILESQGFGGHFSDAIDSSSDQDGDEPDAEKSDAGTGRGEEPSGRDELEDAPAVAPQAGGLSWKGRCASPDSEKRRKARQLRQRPRRSYVYLLAADSSPKYQPGQSCRKIKKKELRSAPDGQGGNVVGAEGPKGQDGSDCTDDRPDLDAEAGKDGQGSEDAGDRYVIKYEKDGEMERVLERQAELIGQYEAEENAQREWEKQFNQNRNSTVGDVEVENKPYQIENGWEQRDQHAHLMDQEVRCSEESKSCEQNLSSISKPSTVSELSQNAPEESTAEQQKVDGEPDHLCAHTTAIVCSFNSELQPRKDELANQKYVEIVKGSRHDLGRSSISAQGSSTGSPVTRQHRVRGDENSDSGSSYSGNAQLSEHYIIRTPSVGSPVSDTLNSKVSEWSSSHFQDHSDNQLDAQLYQRSNDNVGGVLEALQRAKMSLREKLCRPLPPSQVLLALPAPEDYHTAVDLPVYDAKVSLKETLSSSSPPHQEILALPAPEDYHSRIDVPLDDMKIPFGTAGLFRLPTDSFPKNQKCLSDAYGSGFSLTSAATQHTDFLSDPAHVTSVFRAGSVFSTKQYYDPHSSMLLSVHTSGRCNIPTSDFTIGGTSFPSGIPRFGDDFRRGTPPGDADMFIQRGGDYTISNKWML